MCPRAGWAFLRNEELAFLEPRCAARASVPCSIGKDLADVDENPSLPGAGKDSDAESYTDMCPLAAQSQLKVPAAGAQKGNRGADKRHGGKC